MLLVVVVVFVVIVIISIMKNRLPYHTKIVKTLYMQQIHACESVYVGHFGITEIIQFFRRPTKIRMNEWIVLHTRCLQLPPCYLLNAVLIFLLVIFLLLFCCFPAFFHVPCIFLLYIVLILCCAVAVWDCWHSVQYTPSGATATAYGLFKTKTQSVRPVSFYWL